MAIHLSINVSNTIHDTILFTLCTFKYMQDTLMYLSREIEKPYLTINSFY